MLIEESMVVGNKQGSRADAKIRFAMTLSNGEARSRVGMVYFFFLILCSQLFRVGIQN